MDMDILLNKIKTLFEYRDFDHLYALGGLEPSVKERLEHNLILLQQDIYFLDEYLESNWNLEKSELNSYWNRIHQSLSNLGVASKHYDDYSAHIYKYQKHEEQLRSPHDLLRLSIEYFYFYKSCDVKLLRRLIYDHAPKIAKSYSLADWRYFDLITEVNDDVEDLIEDLDTINGNRLQLSITKYGIEEAKQIFIAFIDRIGEQSKARAEQKNTKEYDSIHAKVIEQIDLTKSMLDKSLDMYVSIKSTKAQVG